MAMNTLTFSLDFEFVFGSGTWTDMTAFLDEESRLRWARGVTPNREMATSSLSFTFDNSGGEFTLNNPSSSYFNKLRKGIGVRFGWTYSGTTKWEFRGVLADLRPSYGGLAALNRAEFKCVGLTSLLREYKNYGMALQVGQTTDAALTAIMTAIGNSHYSFTSGGVTLPYVFPRGDALTDLVGVANSEPGGIFFEDGQGRLRFLPVGSMTGGHTSPAHTWGTTIVPEDDVSPDYRNDSQYARVSVETTTYRPTAEKVELYRHPYSAQSGFPITIPGQSRMVIRGEFERMPLDVTTQFSQTIIPYSDTGDSLGVAMDDTATVVTTSSAFVSPAAIQPGNEIRIDQEVMLVGSLLTAPPYAQRFNVTRAQRGTIAAPHLLTLGGNRIYVKRDQEVLTSPAKSGAQISLFADILAMTTTVRVCYTNTPDTQITDITGELDLQVLDVLACETELMLITAISDFTGNITVQRGYLNSGQNQHLKPVSIWKRTTAPRVDTLGASYIRTSQFSSGLPGDLSDIVGSPEGAGGAHITYTGNKFAAYIYNNNASQRVLSELVIGGRAINENAVTAKFPLEKAIPYIFGIPQGPTFAMPFGSSSTQLVQGYALGLLRAGRVPTPWLRGLTFTANQSDNTVSMQSAEIADLVRYTGTGTAREGVDEWYRIMGVTGSLEKDDIIRMSFDLAPSHLWRHPSRAWYSDFNLGVATGVLALGVPNISPPGLWSNTGHWTRVFRSGAYEATINTANADPAVVDVGSADMSVGATINFASSPATYPANTGGLGVAFRANSSSPSTWWEARFNPTTSKVILWNTTDGVVADVAWTSTTRPEIEARVQGNRIRVYVDCGAEPVIDTDSAALGLSNTVKQRFNTATYAGPCAEVTSVVSVMPGFTDFAVQGL